MVVRAMAEQTRVVAPREPVFRTGESHDHVYRVQSGWVARSRNVGEGRQQILAVFLPGDIFGVECMLLARQPEAIEALSVASVNHVDAGQLRRLAASDPAVALRLMFQLGEDERRLHNWVIGLARGDAEARIAAMLLDFWRRLRHRGLVTHDSFTLPMTQQQIGDYTGLTVVHVNRVLRRLREAQLATVRHGSAALHDIQGLRAMSRELLDIYENDAPNETAEA